MKKLILASLFVLPLTSCISREQADTRLEKGCKAGIEFFLENGFEIKSIKRAMFKNSTEFGNGYREVMMFLQISDGWYDHDKEYKCTFAEEWNSLGASHRADIYQINVDGDYYGVKDGKIIGDIETQINLSDAINNAMR